jgi:hypothetical protein
LLINFPDYIINGSNNGAGGVIDIRNIKTQTGIERNVGTTGISTTQRKTYYQGIVLDGYTGGSNVAIQVIVENSNTIFSKLEIDCRATSAFYVGSIYRNSINTYVSGLVK